MTEKDVGDIAAGSTIIAAYVNWLPSVAAALAIVWTLIRIYEWSRFRIFGIKDSKGDFK